MTVLLVLLLGVVALVSIAINIHLKLCLESEMNDNLYTKLDRDLFQNASANHKRNSNEWKEKFIKADRELKEATAKLAKYDRKRDPITGKIVKG
jgi:hypothetical protein